ncbi:hypothetical protein [Saccharolobus caldissimus]|uniref:hypothetical protein n=1 Tax=Saccharolobus caldissimus TaxID=1702097 RepID=UPI001E5C2482|nr:hypothetical protein [Saccharolobus caldissimus]
MSRRSFSVESDFIILSHPNFLLILLMNCFLINLDNVSKESHDPPTIKFGRWLRAKSLYSIMIEDKMSEMKV